MLGLKLINASKRGPWWNFDVYQGHILQYAIFWTEWYHGGDIMSGQAFWVSYHSNREYSYHENDGMVKNNSLGVSELYWYTFLRCEQLL